MSSSSKTTFFLMAILLIVGAFAAAMMLWQVLGLTFDYAKSILRYGKNESYNFQLTSKDAVLVGAVDYRKSK